MKREPSESSNIASVGYDRDTKTLEVEFRSGKVYRYADVPHAVFEEFRVGGYRGGHFHKNIRSLYETWMKVEPQEKQKA